METMQEKRDIINRQNKLIDFLYKQEENYIIELNELRENKEAVYNMIAELHEYIQDGDYIENEYILEKLQDMQELCK